MNQWILLWTRLNRGVNSNEGVCGEFSKPHPAELLLFGVVLAGIVGWVDWPVTCCKVKGCTSCLYFCYRLCFPYGAPPRAWQMGSSGFELTLGARLWVFGLHALLRREPGAAEVPGSCLIWLPGRQKATQYISSPVGFKGNVSQLESFLFFPGVLTKWKVALASKVCLPSEGQAFHHRRPSAPHRGRCRRLRAARRKRD